MPKEKTLELPKFLQPHLLDKLNEDAFEVIKIPLFLTTGPLPLVECSKKIHDTSFPSLVGMLYCVYKDYSRGFLDICLNKNFMPQPLKDNLPLDTKRQQAQKHFDSIVKYLRHGFFHAYFRDNLLFDNFPMATADYMSIGNNSDPFLLFHKCEKNDFVRARKKLIEEADNFYSYIEEWIRIIAGFDKDELDDYRDSFLLEFDFDLQFITYISQKLIYNRFSKELKKWVASQKKYIQGDLKIFIKNNGFSKIEKAKNVYEELVTIIDKFLQQELNNYTSQEPRDSGEIVELWLEKKYGRTIN